jgi:flagellar protein FliO/FliZ
MRLLFACLAAAFFLAAPAGAASDAPPGSNPPNAPDTVLYPKGAAPEVLSPKAGDHFSWNAVLVVILGAAGGIWFWQRARRGAAGPLARGERRLSVAESHSLGNRQYLVVADYSGRKFLLGVCPGRIDLLSPLDGPPPPAP